MDLQRPPRGRLSLAASLAGLLAFAACATGRGAPAMMIGAYQGTIEIESEALPASLELSEGRGGFAARLEVGDRIAAVGRGEGEGRGFSAGLSYDTGCRGHMVLSGHFSEDGRRIEGSVRAEDCTGVLGGRFSVVRIPVR